MSELTPSAGSSRRLIRGRGRIWARIVLFSILAAVLAYVGIAAQQLMRDKDAMRASQDQAVASAGLSTAGHKALAANFTDKDGRLLADPPASADGLIDPDTLIVAHLAGPDATPGNSWKEWEDHLAAVTGRKVVDQIYTNSPDQVAEIGAGKITLLALHAADAPFLVNNYGFQPLAVLGDSSGLNGHRLALIVPAGSAIAKPADIKGHSLVCTVPSSITGYRAAVAFLMHDSGLRPNVDYEVVWSTGMKRSVSGIAEKKYEVAAVSDDKVKSMVAQGAIAESQYKIIYTSPVIPRTTIGYFYNLSPKLADSIRKAIFPAGPTTAPGVLNFVPADYKRDFQYVREIDDQFDPRFDSKTQKNSQPD